MDAYLALLNGDRLFTNSVDSNVDVGGLGATYGDAIPHADNMSLYKPLGNKQQVQFIVGRDTVKEAREISEPMEDFEARSIGLRMPAQVVGWGKTIGMRPTDREPEDPRINDDEHKMDRDGWKVGPLDARWDEKRKVWRAFNDLIADDEEKGLGTFVFSTNEDKTCGFPFLRGRLEDVWSVRKTSRESSTDTGITDDDVKSGRVCIKLNGHALDQNNQIGQWSDVLQVTDICFGSLGEGVCGSETTKEGILSIRTDATFSSSSKEGSIAFTEADAPDDVIFGSMYFTGAGGCGSWAPGIAIEDICTLAGTQFALSYSNDKTLQLAIKALCDKGVAFNKAQRVILAQYTKRDVDLDDVMTLQTTNAFQKTEDWTYVIIDAIEAAIQGGISQAIGSLASSTQTALTLAITTLVALVNQAFAQLSLNLLENCGCSASAGTIEAPNIVLTPISTLRTRIEPPLDLSSETSALQVIRSDYGDLSEQLGPYIVINGLPIPISLGTIKDPCAPTQSVTKNCTI
jgi:hypothetical protein